MMEREAPAPLERSLLLHLLAHRGHQVRFEADQWTTEFGILRAFAKEDPSILKGALRSLEMSRCIYRRVQYVIGYTEPKLVYSLTPSGHRKAMDLYRSDADDRGPDAGYPEAAGTGEHDDNGEREGTRTIRPPVPRFHDEPPVDPIQ